jgi:hypothetical protein
LGCFAFFGFDAYDAIAATDAAMHLQSCCINYRLKKEEIIIQLPVVLNSVGQEKKTTTHQNF